MIFGWTWDQWQKVCDWAGFGSVMDAMTAQIDEAACKRVLDVRLMWLKAGGPESGPGRIII